MSESICQHERRVLIAARSGIWDAALAAHAAECESCADLASVSEMLHATEQPRELEVDLEQASRIWRAADAERQREQAARAMLPLAVGELAACLFGGLALLGFSARYLTSVLDLSEAVGMRFLADPVVWVLGAVVVTLVVGVSLLSLALALGMGVARS